MFDRPDRELQRLEEELLRSEMTDDEFETLYDEIYEEFGPEEEDFLADSPVNPVRIRNYANNYGRTEQPRNPAPRGYRTGTAPAYGGEMDDSRYVAKPGKEKSLTGLVITACLECLAIAGVVLWWLLRIL